MRKTILVTLLVAAGALLLASPGGAVVKETVDLRFDTHKWSGLSGFQFIKIGQGARPVGMGDAYTAAADDINAIFWNPAGLTDVRGTAWTATYTKWLVNSYIFSGAVAYNTRTGRGGVLGASVVAFRPETFKETTIYQPDGTGANVSAGDLAVSLAYALKLTDKFSFGARLSWLHQTLFTFKVDNVALDIGTRFYTGFKSLRVAMSLRNFGPDKEIIRSTFFLPLFYNAGIAAEVFGEKGGRTYLTVTGEALYATDYDLRAHVGGELWLQNLIALRAGYKFGYASDRYSVGVGLKHRIAGDRSLSVDVSYSEMKWFTAPIRMTLGGTF